MPQKKRYDSQLSIPFSESRKEIFQKRADALGVSMSQVLREALDEYAVNHNLTAEEPIAVKPAGTKVNRRVAI